MLICRTTTGSLRTRGITPCASIYTVQHKILNGFLYRLPVTPVLLEQSFKPAVYINRSSRWIRPWADVCQSVSAKHTSNENKVQFCSAC